MNWIKDHENFLSEHVTVLFKDQETEFASLKIQFTCALLELAADKLAKDLTKLSADDKLFSHAFDEVLLTQRELEDINQDWLSLFRENCNLLSLFAVEPYFTRLRNIERRRSMEYIETIISSETAWSPLVTSIDDEDEDEDILKVPEIADNFILMLQSITDRFSHLSKISHQYAFIVLELEMLADFHLRLSQIYRSLDSEGLNQWPFTQRFFSIINTLNYVILLLNNWKNLPVFQDMSEFSLKDSIFEDSLSLYNHMVNEMKKRIVDSLMKLIMEKIKAYASLRWHCFTLLDDDMQYISYQLFYLISKSLELLKRKLSHNILEELIETIADSIKTAIMKEVIYNNSFNGEGAQQLHRDVNINLFSVFRVYTPNPESLIIELVEACQLLNLAKGNSLLLQDTLRKGNVSDDILKDFNVHHLSAKVAHKILSKRLYT
ncbi:RAD50-interacting protein 1 isoform X2 [Tetranychus urticae]|nr:RAD50-interacting protein 1 isoform X2 [Tetranychus urticae]